MSVFVGISMRACVFPAACKSACFLEHARALAFWSLQEHVLFGACVFPGAFKSIHECVFVYLSVRNCG